MCIRDSFPWASAREYSTIENIPEYELDNHKGDCGQVSLLFITLCRISGIPVSYTHLFDYIVEGKSRFGDFILCNTPDVVCKKFPKSSRCV